MAQDNMFKGPSYASTLDDDDNDEESIAAYLQKLKMETKTRLDHSDSTNEGLRQVTGTGSRRSSVLPENPPLFVNTIPKQKSARKSEDVVETLKNFAKFERKYSKTKLVEKQNALKLFLSSDESSGRSESIQKSSKGELPIQNDFELALNRRRQSSKDLISSMVQQSLLKGVHIPSQSDSSESQENLHNVIIDLPSLSEVSNKPEIQEKSPRSIMSNTTTSVHGPISVGIEVPLSFQEWHHIDFSKDRNKNRRGSIFLATKEGSEISASPKTEPNQNDDGDSLSENNLASSTTVPSASISEHLRNYEGPKGKDFPFSNVNRASVFHSKNVEEPSIIEDFSLDSGKSDSFPENLTTSEVSVGEVDEENTLTTEDEETTTTSSGGTTVLSMKLVDHSTQTIGIDFSDLAAPYPLAVTSHIASPKEILRSSTHLPGMAALNSLLRSQLEMTKLNLSLAKQQYESSLANIKPNYRYTTLKEDVIK